MNTRSHSGKLSGAHFGAVLALAALATASAPSDPGSIEGRVLGSDGRVIAGALVAAVPENPGVSEEQTRSAALVRTSRDGRFRFANLPPGPYAVTATMRGRSAAFEGGLHVKPGGTVRGVSLRSPAGGMVLGGTIRTTSGNPIPGAELRAVRYSDFTGDVFYTLADSSGEFTVMLPQATYMLLAVAPGREAAVRVAESKETRTLVLALPPLYPAGPAPNEVVDWFRGTGIPLRGVEAGHGFSDMQALRSIVGKARVVSLGEATHGTREFFQLKHRMLEFLVSEMGFNVFGIEASMPEGFDVNEYVLNGRGDPAKALDGLYFWTWNTKEVLEMIHWMRRYNSDPTHRRKVTFYGFDMQFAPRALKTLLAYFRRVDPQEADRAAAALAPLSDAYRAMKFARLSSTRQEEAAAALAKLLETMDSRKVEFTSSTGEREWALARQDGRVAEQFVEMSRKGVGGGMVRDQSMAENIGWILEREGPASKMVVWAHNGHVSTSQDQGNGMGASLRRKLGDAMVVFGFSFNQGSFQAIDGSPRARGLTDFSVGPAPEGSLDETLARTRYPIAAFDLRGAPVGPVGDWLAAPHKTRSIGALYSDSLSDAYFQKALVTQNYDAILFVEHTSAARRNHRGMNPLSAPAKPDSIGNLDFEDGAVGEVPPGWSAPAGITGTLYRAETSRDHPRGGSRCGMIRALPGNRYGEWSGNLSKRLYAAPYAGKKVRLRASVRVEGHGDNCRAYVWLRGSKPGFGPAAETFYKGTEDQPITSAEWREIEIVGEIPKETSFVDFGVSLAGDGVAWIDSVSLEPMDRR